MDFGSDISKKPVQTCPLSINTPILRDDFTVDEKVRVVPGGSSVRSGAYIAPGVVCMPPMYVNVGAYVDAGTMIDSHALVGSCAQVGRNVHLSAAAQIGGVLEPVNASPVILEDDVLVGGNCGVYEGTLVRRRAVLGSGVILTRSTPVYDIVLGEILSGNGKLSAGYSGRCRRRRWRAGHHPRQSCGVGLEPLHAGHRQVSR